MADTGPYVLETTVQKYVTVREKGKIVRKLVPVVKRVKVFQRRETAFETQLRYSTRVVTTPGAVHTIRRLVTTIVPVVKKQVVKVNGKTYTVVTTRFVPTTRVETVVTTETREVTTLQTVDPADGHKHAERHRARANRDGHEDDRRHEHADADPDAD